MKIGLFGASGKMGQEIQKLISIYPTYEAAVIVDFSSHLATQKHLSFCLEKKVPLVIGTTGHSLEEMKLIEEASKELPIFIAANFSLGIAYMKAMLNLIKKPNYVDIIEQHPASKKDTPSGTALELSKEIGSKNIHSIRSHSHIFSHECKIAFEEEEISIKHTAFNRAPFARGAIEAAKFLVKMPNGLYNMKDLIQDAL